jgi:hypothetical protein
LGRSGQRPELSQATGMALVRCILGKFLGVVCHCFPPRLDIPTFTTRCPHVRHDTRDPSGGRWNCGREYCLVILLKWWLPCHLGIFYMPQIYDMGPTALLPLRRKACWGFIVSLISKFRHVLTIVCFLLGNSQASEFYMPTFWNTLSHLHRRIGMKKFFIPIRLWRWNRQCVRNVCI